MTRILFRNPEQIVTARDPGHPLSGDEQKKLEVLTGKNLVVENGKITSLTSGEPGCDKVVDCESKIVLPGLVDSHTHIIYTGSRYQEFYQRARGETYLQILKAGNGIKRTIRDTEGSDPGTMAQQSLKRVESAVSTGTTSMEMKTGYSASADGEERMLDAMDYIAERGILRVIKTLLPLHAVSMGTNENEHLKTVLNSVIPRLLTRADFVDSFCDAGAFSVQATSRFFQNVARTPVRLHADEIEDVGALSLCEEFEVKSADHLLKTSASGIEILRKTGTIANLLPITAFALNESYADSRRFSEKKVPFAISTDSSPLTRNQDLLFAMHLGVRFCGMSVEAALNGCTLNASYSLGINRIAGSLEPGKDADLVIFDLSDYREIPYEYASSPVSSVFSKGRQVYAKC